MAKEVIVRLRDDVDGTDAVETIEYTWEGVTYEIDLSEENSQKFRDQMEHWVEHSRMTERRTVRSVVPVPEKKKATTDKEQLAAIREWARGKGLAVSDRGRVRQEIIDLYNSEAGK